MPKIDTREKVMAMLKGPEFAKRVVAFLEKAGYFKDQPKTEEQRSKEDPKKSI